jgi:WD40 repeat protein
MKWSDCGLLIAWIVGVHAQASPITTLAFTPDGLALVSGRARVVEVRSPTNGTVLQRWDIALPKITAARFDGQGRFLALAGGVPGERGEVFLLSWPEGKPLYHASFPGDLATSLDFSPDASRLVVAGAQAQAYVWNLPREDRPTTQQELGPPSITLSGHAGPVLAVAWDPAGGWITSAGADRSIKVWSSETGLGRRTFTHHTEPPNVLAFRPRDRNPETGAPSVLASGSDDRTVRIWQPGLGRMVRITRKHQGPILCLAWMPDGSALFSGGSEGVLRRMDAASDEVLDEWRGADDWILALAIHPDGTRLASGDASGQVHMWDIRKEKPAVHFRGPPGP